MEACLHGHGDVSKSLSPTIRQTPAFESNPKKPMWQSEKDDRYRSTLKSEKDDWYRSTINAWGIQTYPVWNSIKLKHLHWTHYKVQTNKQGNHCSPTGSGGDNIFPFSWKKQVAARIIMRTFLSWTSTPLWSKSALSNTRNEKKDLSIAKLISNKTLKNQEAGGSPDKRGKQA